MESLRIVHVGGARHSGPCSSRCGGLPVRRVALDGRCLVDTEPHEGCAVHAPALAAVEAA